MAHHLNSHSTNTPHQQQHLPMMHQMSYTQTNLDHLTMTPCLEDLDTEFQFEVEVPMDEKEKKLWYYDAFSKRLFVKGDQDLTAIINYRTANCALNLRLMPVYTSRADIRKPVLRCPNHKEQCKTNHREHIVHCHHEGALYCGSEQGENFASRLSVVIPLHKSCQTRQYGEKVQEEIVFAIGCLNSCSGISRRATALIFTLENENMEILGRTVMNFRSCTSPKRDFEADKRKRGIPSSSTEDPGTSSAKRPMIVKQPDGSAQAVVKIEQPETSSQETEEMVPSPSGGCLLTLSLPDKEAAMKVLLYAQDYLSGEVTRGRDVPKKFFKQMNRQIGE